MAGSCSPKVSSRSRRRTEPLLWVDRGDTRTVAGRLRESNGSTARRRPERARDASRVLSEYDRGGLAARASGWATEAATEGARIVGKKLYVGNLAYEVTGPDLEDHFKQAGRCVSASVIMDRATGKSRGFGFVEMESDDDAQ